MIERASENEVGKFVHIDYKMPVSIRIPSGSADLITLNMGLHHFPQGTVMPFLREVYRLFKIRTTIVCISNFTPIVTYVVKHHFLASLGRHFK